MIAVEVCIGCADATGVCCDAGAALVGGAMRVKLCGQMQDEGLTPDWELVRIARSAFTRPGVLVMIRTWAGDFSFALAEVRTMEEQIRRAVDVGADGVVIGALCADGALNRAALAGLVAAAKECDLEVSLHRAFDATPDPAAALETLVELQFDRVLTSGTPWHGAGGAVAGLVRVRSLVEQAAGRIEVVVGGGVSPENANFFVSALPGNRWSLHAYSGVRMDGRVRAERVRSLVASGRGL